MRHSILIYNETDIPNNATDVDLTNGTYILDGVKYKIQQQYTSLTDLTQYQLQYVVSLVNSNKEAAAFLHMQPLSWYNMASKYINPDTKLTYAETLNKKSQQVHSVDTYIDKLTKVLKEKNIYSQQTLDAFKRQKKYYTYMGDLSVNENKYLKLLSIPMIDIFQNKYPNYDVRILQYRLITEGWLKEKCNHCGYDERRLSDYEVPLRLAFKDGDIKNFSLNNLELVCYNCYFQMYGSPIVTMKSKKTPTKYYFDEVTGELVELNKIDNYINLNPKRDVIGPFFNERKESLVKWQQKHKLQTEETIRIRELDALQPELPFDYEYEKTDVMNGDSFVDNITELKPNIPEEKNPRGRKKKNIYKKAITNKKDDVQSKYDIQKILMEYDDFDVSQFDPTLKK